MGVKTNRRDDATRRLYYKNTYRIKSTRLPDWDYSSDGAYFMTICAKDREYSFGKIVNGKMRLNDFGQIIYDEWKRSATIRREIELDEFVIMPNHLHGIIILKNVETTRRVVSTKAHPCGPVSGSIGAIIGQFKSITTKRINNLRKTPGKSIWQRNYYDHIIRDKNDFNRIKKYILENPLKWNSDENNPNKK